MTDGRAPFHPLRFVDMWIENWKKASVLFGIFIFAIWAASEVYRHTGSEKAWFAILIGIVFIEISIIPRFTLYGRELGTPWNGWLYRQIKARRRDGDGGDS